MAGHEGGKGENHRWHGLNGFFYEHEFSMKAMTRTKLAECAGVSRKTLGKYIEGHLAELQPLGLRPRDILPPSVVEWLSRNYGIDVDD